MKHEMMLTFMMRKIYPLYQAPIPMEDYLQKTQSYNLPSSGSANTGVWLTLRYLGGTNATFNVLPQEGPYMSAGI